MCIEKIVENTKARNLPLLCSKLAYNSLKTFSGHDKADSDVKT